MKTLLFLKEASKNLLHLIIFASLIPVALFLLALVQLCAIGFYLATIRSKKQNAREILQNHGATYKLIAVGIDILGNIIGGSFFNWLLLKKLPQFPFGIPGEKISTVVELNYKLDNLSEWGLNLRHDLNTIETDHCERSLLADLFTNQKFLEKYKVIQAKFETAERTREFMAKY